MYEYYVKNIGSSIDLLSRAFSFLFKVGLLLGGSCLILYCYRLNYFPAGLSVGDGFLLIALAASFGFVYGLFVVSLSALGLWFTPILRSIQNLVFWLRRRCKKSVAGEHLDLVRPDMNALVFGGVGVLFILVLAQVEPSAAWTLPATAFVLGIVLATYQRAAARLAQISFEEAMDIIIPPRSPQLMRPDKERLRIVRFLSPIAIFTLPLLVGGVSGVLLDSAMHLAKIKKDASHVMLKEPYSQFVPEQLKADKWVSVADYTTFESVDVVFSGVGQKTVIEFQAGDGYQRLAVPNDEIIVIPSMVDKK